MSFSECHYGECRYAECRYAECRYAECHYAECHFLSVVMLNVGMLNIVAPLGNTTKCDQNENYQSSDLFTLCCSIFNKLAFTLVHLGKNILVKLLIIFIYSFS